MASAGLTKCEGLIKAWPDIGVTVTACLALEQRLYIGQPDFIRPAVAVDGCPMTAMIVEQ
jgi:hypothetical protein